MTGTKDEQVLKAEKRSMLRRPWLWPLLPVFLIGWLARGGLRYLWDEFLCFLFMDFEYDKDGNPVMVYFMSMSPWTHFHPLSWGPLVLAGILTVLDPATYPQAREIAGLVVVLQVIQCGLAVSIDLPFKSFWISVIVVFAFVPLADFGLATLADVVDARLVGQGWPELFSWAERGVLRPAWDGIQWLDTGVSPGWLVLFSIPWTVVVVYHLILSLLDDRYGYDGQNLVRWKFGEGSASEPTYYSKAQVRTTDMLEGMWGFASVLFGSGKNSTLLRNIPMLGLPGRKDKFDRIRAGHAILPSEQREDGGLSDGQMAKNRKFDPDNDGGDADGDAGQ
jgi:hypothetical protein